MKYILALDQGTTSSRAILFDHSGELVSAAQKEFSQIFPEPGWVEHNPAEIYASQLAVAKDVLAKSGASPADIVSIGITNQRETTILWNRKTGEPVCNAIVWQDRRTSSICEALKQQHLEQIFRSKTGLVLDPYFSGTKIQWILDNIPNARRQAEKGELAFGTVDSWLLWKLTGGQVHATDITNASRTLLFNLHSFRWDDELLRILRIPPELLPEVQACAHPFATTSVLGGEIPITGIAGDQQAALFGQACFDPGMLKSTYGTGCFILMNTGTTAVRSQHNLLTTVAWKLDQQVEYALEGSVFIGGAVVQWLRDALKLISTARDVEALAKTVPDNGGVYFVPAFAGLGAPIWDSQARGTLLGITRGTTSGHIARAALEAIAYQVYDVVEAMQKDSGIQLSELHVDGGASINQLLMQFQTDILGIPVVRPPVTESTALGAAFLAGIGAGFWKNRQEVAAILASPDRFIPGMESRTRDHLLEKWRKAVQRSLRWAEEGYPQE